MFKSVSVSRLDGSPVRNPLIAARIVTALVAATLPSCSLDWDRLDPSKGAAVSAGGTSTGGTSTGGTSTGGMGGSAASSGASGGAAGEGSGGDGATDTGGAPGGGGDGSGGDGGTGGTPPTLVCENNELPNPGFETGGGFPNDWTILQEIEGAGATLTSESGIVDQGNRSLRFDTRSVSPTGPYEALVGVRMSSMVSVSPGDTVRVTMRVRVEEAPDDVVLVALFRNMGAMSFSHELELDVIPAKQGFVESGGEVIAPEGVAEFGVGFRVPVDTLMYADDACGESVAP